MSADQMERWQKKLDELEEFREKGTIGYKEYKQEFKRIHSQKPLSAGAWTFNLIFFSIIILIVVMCIVFFIDSMKKGSEANKIRVAEIAKEAKQAEKKNRSATIKKYSSAYCKKRQNTVVTNTTGKWPLNDGSGWTTKECKTIISKLYDAGVTGDDNEFELVINGNYAIGMYEMSVIYSLGTPNDVNTTRTGTDYVRRQLVYGNPLYGATYIYTENGKVTSVQN